MNITDKVTPFKDLGLRLASEVAVGYPIRATDLKIFCSLKECHHQLQLTPHEADALTSFRIWLIALASIVSGSQDRNEGKIPE